MKRLLLIGLCLGLYFTAFSYQANGYNTNNLAIITVTYASVYISPNENKEITTQVLYGDLVTIIKGKGHWVLIDINKQSDYKNDLWQKYRGWIKLSVLKKITPSQRKRYLTNRVVLINREEGLYLTINRFQGKTFKHDKIVMQGTILPALAQNGKMIKLLLPSGKVGFVNKKNVRFLKQARGNETIYRLFLKTAYKFVGKKYIWGGITPHGVDCSGLTYFAARSAGIIIPRDAAPQFKALKPIKRNQILAGDLIYFSTDKKRVSHVGIYLGKMKLLHAIGKKVKISSLNDKDLSNTIIGYRSLNLKEVKIANTAIHTPGLYGQYLMSLSQEKNVLKIVKILNHRFKTPIYVIPFWNKTKIFYRIFGGFYNSKRLQPGFAYKRKRTTPQLIKRGLFQKSMFSIQIAALRDPYLMIKKLKELSKKQAGIWLKYEKNKQGILWSVLLYNHFRSFAEAEQAYKAKSYRLQPKPYIRKFRVK